MDRLKKVEKIFVGKNIWFSNENDVYYLTKFKSTNLNIFFIENKWYALTDDRYYSRAKKEIENIEVLNQKDKNFTNFLSKKIKNGILYIDGNNIVLNQYTWLKEQFNNIEFKTIDLTKLREVKNIEEINNIKKAVEITDDIFNKFLKYVKPGMTELEAKNFVLKQIIDSEAEKESFDTIVAGGSNSANPHYNSSNYIFKENDVVLIDFGVFYNGYCSDMTRTFKLGNGIEGFDKIYEIVKKSLEVGINIIKDGIMISDIDKNIRKYISDQGYGDKFIHSSGHGIGIEIHESPNIYGANNDKLKEGMIITIEPGIYLEDKFGIRLEQDVLVKKNGYVILNKSEL